MKTIKQTFNLILTVALWLVAVQTAFAQKMVVKTADGKVVKYNVAKVTEVTFEEAEPVEWVDLGLPSGTLWASCNIGANNPEDYGDFFAWGETEQKSDYTWSTYFDYDESSHRSTKYCNDGGLTELLPEDDAASTLWDVSCKMPSKAQFEELLNSNYTTQEWTQLDGVNGTRITSIKNGNSIFLPAAGFRNGTSLISQGSDSYYWSRTLSESSSSFNYAECIYSFNAGSLNTLYSSRVLGFSVRPVRAHVAPPIYNLCPDDNHPHAIDLYLKSGTKWACCNVGANSPEDVGYYFAWGETEPKTTYTENNYFIGWNEVSSHDELKPEYDAATANMGSPWHMPSYEQLEELQQRCRTVEWTEINGVKGVIISKKLFLPVSGRYYGDELDYPYTPTFWTSTIYSSERTPNMPNPNWGGAYIPGFYLGESAWDITHLPFYLGLPIRAVCE